MKLFPFHISNVLKLDRNRTRDRCGISNRSDKLIVDEEIAEENAEIFEKAGGNTFSYIPCLNARHDHIKALSAVIRQDVPGWFAP